MLVHNKLVWIAKLTLVSILMLPEPEPIYIQPMVQALQNTCNVSESVLIIHAWDIAVWTSDLYISPLCLFFISPNFPNLLPRLQREGLVLRCPSSCNDSNSLMLMACLSFSPCWDHQPTSRGHGLAPGREGPWTGETGETEKERRETGWKRALHAWCM